MTIQNIVVNNKVIQTKKVKLYSFNLYDEDYTPMLVREEVELWKKTSLGQWCMEHASDITIQKIPSHYDMSHQIIVTGILTEENYTWFLLMQ